MHACGAPHCPRASIFGFGPFVNGLELNRTAICGGELRIRHRDRAPALAAEGGCYKFSASFLGGGSGGSGGRLKLTFAEDGGGVDGKVKRIVVVDALAKRESSSTAVAVAADVTVFEGRATAAHGGVVTAGEADEDNGAVNRNGGAFVIFDRGECTVRIRPDG